MHISQSIRAFLGFSVSKIATMGMERLWLDWCAYLSVSRWAMHRYSSCLINHTYQKIFWYRYVHHSFIWIHSDLNPLRKLATVFNVVFLPGCSLISSINFEVMYYVVTIGSGCELKSKWCSWRWDWVNAGSQHQEGGQLTYFLLSEEY